MNLERHFKSISAELEVVKDRVRYMIHDAHWPTDGEWKESVLRTAIRRSAPSAVSVGRGFVVTRDGASPQIDVLIYDNAHPVLYRDGDLVFIAPAACRAAIEVKSRLSSSKFAGVCEGLADTAEFIRMGSGGEHAFIGLFSYEEETIKPEKALAALAAAARKNQARVIDHTVLGTEKFIKWWPRAPQDSSRRHEHWHAYDLNRMAAGYFLHNLFMHLSPDAQDKDGGEWFPEQSKEARLVAVQPLR